MHIPTQSQWQAVIDNFKKVLPLAARDEQLDMDETDVNEYGHVCATVHCVGGWYAVSVIDQFAKEVSYTDGTAKMAAHLGFEHTHELELFAQDNPNIWGNEAGYFMFCSVRAYDGALNLADVVNHLEAVKQRSPIQ